MTNSRRPLSFIPNFLPDQTLYSWVRDYHLHSGNATPEISVEQLFWTTGAGWSFHLPSHLDNFCASTRRIFGEPEDIIAERTILPAYLWFRPEPVKTEITTRLRGKATAGIPQRLGLWKTSTGSACSRRFCAKCCEEESRKHGEPYWHRSLQLPGVMVCLEHQQPLLISKTGVRNKDRHHFATPKGDLSKKQCEPLHICNSSTMDLLLKITAVSIQLVQLHTESSPRQPSVHRLLLNRLRQLGIGTIEDPQTALTIADSEYKNHIRQVVKILYPPFEGPSSMLLGQLLLGGRCKIAALEYVLVIQWLFDEWHNFWRYYISRTNAV